MQHDIIDKTEIFKISCISFILFSIKWFLSFYLFSDENLTIKIIEDISSTPATFDSHTYLHYVKALSNLDFEGLYNSKLSTTHLIVIPYGSVVFHAFFYKVLGDFGFILVEYISITLFIIVFYKIFRVLNFSKPISLLLAVLFFTTPSILDSVSYLGIAELKTFAGNFYNLRFPRPLIANLIFFYFIYTLLKGYLYKNIFHLKNLLIFSILLGLSATSFFFIFLVLSLTLVLFLVIEFKLDLYNILRKNFKNIFISLVFFLFIILPFFYLIINSNPEYMRRMGVYEIGTTDKIFLIEYYFQKIFRLKLIVIYILLLFSYFLMKKFNYSAFQYIRIFYILFLSSIISPILFILFSSKIAFLYHFNNMVVVCLMLLIIFILILNMSMFFSKVKLKSNFNFLIYSVTFFIIFFSISRTYIDHINNFNTKARNDRNNIINLINNINFKDITTLLTFDKKIMTWSILRENLDLYLVDGTYSQRRDAEIENDLIRTFKLFNFEVEFFKRFISNKKIGYRYNNPDLKNFFWQKYTANSSYIYQNSTDFDKDVLNFIKSSSPYYSHQFAIPNFEISRLLKKFNSHQLNTDNIPDVIINNKVHPIFQKVKIDHNLYCMKFEGEELDLYILKKYCD